MTIKIEKSLIGGKDISSYKFSTKVEDLETTNEMWMDEKFDIKCILDNVLWFNRLGGHGTRSIRPWVQKIMIGFNFSKINLINFSSGRCKVCQTMSPKTMINWQFFSYIFFQMFSSIYFWKVGSMFMRPLPRGCDVLIFKIFLSKFWKEFFEERKWGEYCQIPSKFFCSHLL